MSTSTKFRAVMRFGVICHYKVSTLFAEREVKVQSDGRVAMAWCRRKDSWWSVARALLCAPGKAIAWDLEKSLC